MEKQHISSLSLFFQYLFPKLQNTPLVFFFFFFLLRKPAHTFSYPWHSAQGTASSTIIFCLPEFFVAESGQGHSMPSVP